MTRAFGFQFTPLDLARLATTIAEPLPPDGKLSLVVTMNVDHVRTLAVDPEFRAAYDSARVVTADGFPVFVYARLKGCDVPERVTGADLLPEILKRIDPGVARVAFVCSTAQVATRIQQHCVDTVGFSREAVLCIVPPVGFDKDPAVSASIASRIGEFRATHVFMGVGAPKSEKWAYRYLREGSSAWCCCFGAGLDYFAQTKVRAPLALRRVGLEWLWRLGTEPRRLSRRYVLGAGTFVRLALRDWRD